MKAAIFLIVVSIAAALAVHRARIREESSFPPVPIPPPGKVAVFEGKVAVPDEPIPARSWYALNLDHTACVQSNGPAPLIEDLRLTSPRVSEYTDGQGKLSRVRVSISQDSFTEQYRDFYTTQQACEYEAQANSRLADRYR